MAHSKIAEIEMQGHYIEIDGPSSECQVLEVLDRLISPASVAHTTHGPPLLTLRDGRTIIFVDVDPGPDRMVILAIGNLGNDDEARERAAEAVCRALVERTPWRLRCSTDTNADGGSDGGSDGGGGAPGMRWAC